MLIIIILQKQLIIQSFQMKRKIFSQIPEEPLSKSYQSIKKGISELMLTVAADKNLSSNTRQSYLNSLKQIDWGIGKVIPRWPIQVQRMMQTLRSYINDFQLQLVQANNTGICGGSRATKNVESSFKNIIGFKQVFPLIGHYQDKNLKQELIHNVIDLYEKYNQKEEKPPKQIIKEIIRQVPVHIPIIQTPPPMNQVKQVKEIKEAKQEKQNLNEQIKLQNFSTKCQFCELYLSLSLQPNSYKVKQLLKSLPNTQWIYGILYEEGKIFQRSLEKAINYYQKAIQKNNPDSLYRLGELNQRQQYGQPMQYIQMWKKSAELGNLEAITDIGYLFQNGIQSENGDIMMEKNYNKAQQYYLRAAKQNFPRALNNLGSFYLQNPTLKDLQKSQIYFNKAIDAGYVKAYFNLGICYSQGLLKDSNKQKAKQLFKRGAQLGDHQSKLFYVDILLNNQPIKCSEQELQQAHQYCRQMIATEQQRAQAYYFLGIMYQNGLGVPIQLKTAVLYFLKSAKLQYQHAIIKIADMYRVGNGIQKDFREALHYYQKVQQNRPQVFVSMGIIFQEGSDSVKRNFQRAFELYSTACKKNIAEGFFKIADMYKLGRYVKKDQNKANQYIKKGQQLMQIKTNQIHDKTHLTNSQTDLVQSSYFRTFQKGKK